MDEEDETKTHNLLRNHTHTSESTITCQKHEGKSELKRGVYSLYWWAIWSMDSTLLKLWKTKINFPSFRPLELGHLEMESKVWLT